MIDEYLELAGLASYMQTGTGASKSEPEELATSSSSTASSLPLGRLSSLQAVSMAAGVREGFVLATLAVHVGRLDSNPLSVGTIKDRFAGHLNVSRTYGRHLLAPGFGIYTSPALLFLKKGRNMKNDRTKPKVNTVMIFIAML